MNNSTQNYVELQIYVKPGSRNTRLVVEDNEYIFYTVEPPTKGRANYSLIKYLSRLLGVSKNDIVIVSGTRDRVKRIRIYNIDRDQLLSKLK